MKKITQKIMAGLLALAMIFGGFAGTGLEVGATDAGEYPTVLKVRVEDSNGNPVSGVQLYLKSTGYGANANKTFKTVTGADGKAEYQCDGQEMDDDLYELQPVMESDYICEAPVEVTFGIDDDWNTYVATAGDKDPYSGEEIVLVVKSNIPSYPTTLKVKVQNEKGSSVSGVQLCLKSSQGEEKTFKSATGIDGKAEYQCDNLEIKGNAYELQTVEGSKYVCKEPIKVTFATDDKNNTYIAAAGGSDPYAGKEIVLEVVPAKPTVLAVKVRDENYKPVSDIPLYLKSTKYGAEEDRTLKAVDAEGKVEYQCDNTEKDDDTYVLQPAADSKYTCETPINVTFGNDGGKTYIATAGGVEYEGNEVTLSVKGTQEGEPPVKEYQTELKVKVQKADKTGVPGVALRLNTDTYYGKHEIDFMDLTGENGEVVLSCEQLDDLDATAPAYVLESADGTYEFDEAVKVTFGYDEEEELAYVKAVEVDGAPYTGDLITLTVKGSEVPDTPLPDKPTELKVKAQDEKGAVSGVQLYLRLSVQGKDKTFKAVTRADGTAEYQCDDTESTDGVFELLPVENSGYESVSAVKVTFKSNDDKTYIESVGGKEYEGEEILLQLKKKDAGQTVLPPVTKVVKVTKIQITGASKKIAAGKKIQLTASVLPTNASNKSVTWTTSNKKYATVDSKGKVSVKKAGAGRSVTITATAADGSGVKATYKIKIQKDTVKSIQLKAKKTVKAGKSLKVKATVKTTGKKANKTLKWTSSNTKYATVSAKGVVKAKKAGKGCKVKITASATDGSGKKKTVTIKIK